MIKLFGLLTFIFSVHALASTEHACVYKNINVTIFTDRENDISVHLLKDGVEFTTCKMKVLSYYDGKTGESLEELIRFEKISCDVKDTSANTDVEVIKNGFVKTDLAYETSAAYVILNEQPLMCSIK